MDDAQFYYLNPNLDNEVYYKQYMGDGGKLKIGSEIDIKTDAWYEACRIAEGSMPIPEEDPCHDYHIYNPRYKFVDWIYSFSLDSNRLFFSKRIIEVLKKYKIDTHKIYPTIWERRGVMIPDYYYHLQLFGDQIDNIDFENSVFDICKKYRYDEIVETNVKIKDITELVKFWKGTNDVELICKTVTLKGEKLDLFKIRILGWWGPIVSKSLKLELESVSDNFDFIKPIDWLKFSL